MNVAGDSGLSQILAEGTIRTFYQPVVSLNRCTVIGYEALVRGPENHILHSADLLFAAADASGQRIALEKICCLKAVENFRSDIANKQRLSINLSALFLENMPEFPGELLEHVKAAGLKPKQIIIELTERDEFSSFEKLNRSFQRYRQQGFELALDDVGAGYSGLQLWCELKPDIVKIDRYFIRDIYSNPTKKEFLRTVVSLAQASGTKKIVAEGIETKTDLHQLLEVGIEHGQGYLFGRPALNQGVNDTALVELKKSLQQQIASGKNTVNDMIQFEPAVHMDTRAGVLLDRFLKHTELQSLAVVNDRGQPKGLVQRSKLLELFSTPYGRALNEQRPISAMMNESSVVVDRNTSLEEVSRQVTEEDGLEMSAHFIITEQDSYAGLGSVKSLLRHITESNLQNARYANPLTLLPGNVPIYREIERLIYNRSEFVLAYVDLNHFKPYNDVYGYGSGDMVIQLVAELLNMHALLPGNFVGHIGGDDFVIIFTSDDWQQRCQNILDEFDTRIRHYYDEQDLQRGFIRATGRDGELNDYPILSLAIGAVIPSTETCKGHNDVATLASDAKKQAKRIRGSGLYVSHKSSPYDTERNQTLYAS